MVSIRPEVAMYAAFARLNYKPWFALAEFVDNAVQSALHNVEALRDLHGPEYRLLIEILIDDNSIEIRDNAAGISDADYPRAFQPASPPPNATGLSEFGLGMKAAASWFAENWSVRTSSISEEIERTIVFDVPRIVTSNIDVLEPIEVVADRDSHYTTLMLTNLRVRPKGRTLGKISNHLASIYRRFIMDNFLDLRLNGQTLRYEGHKLLEAPFHATPSEASIYWKKDFELDLGDKHAVRGWAGILERGSVANAGFAVFRRRRLILGSHGEGYRPEAIFGSQNKFVYQRLVGEIDVEGFAVSHTKDGIQWSDWEDDILEWLKIELDAEPIRILHQALHYRARLKPDKKSSAVAAKDVSDAVAQRLPPVIDEQVANEPNTEPVPAVLPPSEDKKAVSETVEIALEHANKKWQVSIELVTDSKIDSWYELAERDVQETVTLLSIRVNIAHPFLERFASSDRYELIPFVRLAAGIAIAETTSTMSGVRNMGTFRNNLNQILRTALSGPVFEGS